MMILDKILIRLYMMFTRAWNSRYYQNGKIHPSVIFCASYRGVVHVSHLDKLAIGEGSVLNADSVLDAEGGISIGHHVHAGRGLVIYSSNHNYRSDNSIPYDNRNVLKPVTIEDCVWLGANVSIIPGITIGEGAVIAMGSVVTMNVPNGAIVGGNPAKVIGHRDWPTYLRLKQEGRFA